jgi:peptide/nickel transport system ATP-binding protein
MYAGRIVEEGAVDAVLDRPFHPYTRGLLDSVPANNTGGVRLRQIPGMTPSLLRLAPGCAFRERCARAGERCGTMPELVAAESESERRVRCHYPLHIEARQPA